MGKINILSSKVFNRIAAGEVVERPSSVVKELIENSIDAGAKKITLEIVDGGITQIKIIDDGVGIYKDDLDRAILPHATSKIFKVEDLDAIKTLGFRGEALASICSVSKINITSKTADSDMGAMLTAVGGDDVKICDCSTTNGTTITVNNLFYNTPVRARFLKTAKSEENEVSQTITRFILGNSDVSFKYIVDGKVVYQSYGDGIESSFLNIYGIKTLNDCHKIETEKNGIKISGYIGKPFFTKPNRSYQTVFLNGRFVINQTISSSIMNAYSSYLMKRQYPFYVLNINIPNEYVDVNVHPNKIDVRFVNNQIVYGSLYSVISKVLDGSQEVLNIVENNLSNKIPTNNEIINKNTDTNYNKYSFDNLQFFDSSLNNSVDKTLNDIERKKENNDKNVEDIFLENKRYLEQLEKKKEEENIKQAEIKVDRELVIVGQALNTFIILEDGQDLFIIDQHAAHERLLFDRIIENVSKKTISVQPLLVPFMLNTNGSEYEFILSKIENLKEFGIDICEFGSNTFKISAIPIYLSDMDIGKFFESILTDINNLKTLTVKDLLFEKFAQKACKSAIKSGDKLNESEINCLLKMMQGNLSLKCPHGRPVAVKITRYEIDKWFKRIV